MIAVRRSRRHRAACIAGLAASIWLATALPTLASECTRFVRAGFVPDGGETADGTSPARAFASIGAAAAAVINPGTVICVGPGSYREGDVNPALGGSQGAPVEFRADPSGESTGDAPGPVALAPPDGLPAEETPRAGFRLMGRRYVVIEGFDIAGFADAGIQVRSESPPREGNSSEIVIRGNRIEACGVGIDVSAERRITVEDNEVVNSGSTGINVSACRGSLLTSSKCRSGESETVVPQVSNNRTVYNFSHGVFIQEAAGGFVQNTIAFGNLSGVTARNATALVIANNLLYGNFQDGLALGGGAQPTPDAVVLNNTLYDNGGWGLVIGEADTASPNARVLNNVISQNDSGAIAVARSSTCGYVAGFNAVDGDQPYGMTTPANLAYDLRGDPGLVDPDGTDNVLGWRVMNGVLIDYSADDDFRLRTGAAASAAVDAGYTTAASLGLQGSSITGAAADDGRVDLGYHYGASTAQRLLSPLPPPSMPIYVRSGGADTNPGTSSATALASLTAASKRAKAGVTVIVGPGTYAASNVGPEDYSGLVSFRGDAMGTSTGDAAGPVLVDPSMLPAGQNKDTGFLLMRNCRPTVEGFHIRFASDAGIQVRLGADGAVVRNNVVFTNNRGISVIDANDATVLSNLIYDNDGGAIDIGGTSGAARTRVQNNTCWGNVGGNGLTIGSGDAATPNTRVEFNIFGKNGRDGVNARESYTGRFNVFFENAMRDFGGVASRKDGDLIATDPLFVDADGADDRLGGRRFEDDRFELQQQASGDAATSVLVDRGPITAVQAGVSSGTTRSDGEPDSGPVDIGFHYPARAADNLYVDPDGDDTNSGRLPQLPLRTIAQALTRAMAGTRVHLAAGLYPEANLRPGTGVSIIGAGPDRSVVAADGGATVFEVRQPDVTLQHVGITGASDAGVRIRSDRLNLVDTWIYANEGRGVVVPQGIGGLLFNNLIYANGGTGIAIGSNVASADKLTVAHNTIYGNAGFGISVGLETDVASPNAVVLNNLIAHNTLKGIGTSPASATTLAVGHNCNRDGYRGLDQPPTDLVSLDPGLVGPDETPLRSFRLLQEASGDEQNSPCVDAGWRTVEQVGLQAASTRRDGAPDVGAVDVGYHYGLSVFDPAILPLLRFGAPAGDCNGDGATRVTEAITAVNIALGNRALDSCATLDIDGDGRIAINELLSVINELLEQ